MSNTVLPGAYYAAVLAYSAILSTQIQHQNIAISYIHITLHLFLFFYGINQLIIIFKLLTLDIPILNVVIVSD